MGSPIFLSLDHVLRLHARQIEQFGGSNGIRDIGLIESAIAQPQQIFGGQYLYEDLAAMAAAYLFHLTKNHGFVDGNKRIGSVCALVFLEFNAVDTDGIDETELELLVLSIADGSAGKEAATLFFRKNVVSDQ